MKSNYNFRNTHLLATFFIFCNFNFFGQNLNNITPPSPNAASLGQYADVPVSNYTGIPSISIPLYTIKSGEIELPITLNYHASGIKVAQEASWVGLGWSLDAGGVITRQIRGGDDFKASGYIQTRNLLPPNSENLPPWTSDNSQNILIKEYYDLVRLGEIDAEPDLFYYNFLGYSGKLMFEKQIPSGGTYKATSLEQNNLVFYYDFLNYVWIVTDDKGWVYRFGTRESSEDASVISQQNGTADTSMISVQSPTTASLSTKTWFIDKIDTPNNNRIDFIYGKKRYRTDTQFYQEQIEYKLLDKILDSGVNVACNLPGDKIVYFGSKQTTYDIYLDRITFESGSVVFNTTDRF
ncbi:MAG TPA: hypothetical protein VF465_04180, partial [Flavobacterium sp.]|uniref:hypothetical protein n=1 Tax=Flavobacterium sp. TaxID=239 RepID=UPI002ED2E758